MIIKVKILAFIIYCSILQTNEETVITRFNENHTTTIFLLKNKVRIDSLIINDYYGKNNLTKINNNKWLFRYSNRCGTGCKITNQIVFSVKNNKLIKSINILSSYLENKNLKIKNFKSQFILSKVSNEGLIIKKICALNDKIYYTKMGKLKFDKVNQIYFNKKFSYKNKVYKGVSIDSSEYIFINKKWYEFDSKNVILYNEV